MVDDLIPVEIVVEPEPVDVVCSGGFELSLLGSGE